MKNVPSAKRLESVLRIDAATAKKARAVMDGTSNAVDVSARAMEYRRACHHPPTDTTLRLYALDEILGGYGVEYIAHKDDGLRDVSGLEYVNMGDTYAGTVMWDHARGSWRLASWGDIVERDAQGVYA